MHRRWWNCCNQPERWKTGNEFFIITNFNDNSYPSNKNGELDIHFPKGKWVEVLNTDDAKYGGTGRCLNKNHIECFEIGDNENYKVPVRLKEMSTVYFKKIAWFYNSSRLLAKKFV